MAFKKVLRTFLYVNILFVSQYVCAGYWFSEITKLTTQSVPGGDAVQVQGEWFTDPSGSFDGYFFCTRCTLSLYVVVCKFGKWCRPSAGASNVYNVTSFRSVDLVNPTSWASAMNQFVEKWGRSGNINVLVGGKFQPDYLVCSYWGIAQDSGNDFQLVPNGNVCVNNPPIDTWCNVNWPLAVDLGKVKAGVKGEYTGRSIGSISCNYRSTAYVSIISKENLNGLPIQFSINNININPSQQVIFGTGRDISIDLRATVVGKFSSPGVYQANAVFLYSFL